jgi:predicted nucleic acid-binding Zn ribbon protein
MSTSQPPQKIPPHKHCLKCGRSIPVNKEFCSAECQEFIEGEENRRKRRTRLVVFSYLGLFIVIILVFVLPTLLRGR